MSSWKKSKNELPGDGELVIILTPQWNEYIIARYDKYCNRFVKWNDSEKDYPCYMYNIRWCYIPKYDLYD